MAYGAATAFAVGLPPGHTSAAAQSYDVKLGGTRIGTLVYDATQGGSSGGALRSVLDNTPLGVGNGSFEATALVASDGGTVNYTGLSQSSRETRRIDVSFVDGRAADVVIAPPDEATDLSDPARVPLGVIDPVSAFGRLAGGRDCPAPFTFYDGRRVLRVSTTARAVTSSGLRCELDYAVTAGPGHLSPFRFRSLKLVVDYTSGGMSGMSISTGPFTVTIAR